MKLKSENILLVLFFLCIPAPYLIKIFYSNSINVFIHLGIDFALIGLLVISVVIYWASTTKKLIPAVLAVIALSSIATYTLYHYELMRLSDRLFISRNEEQLNKFVDDIKKYRKITSMTDGLKNVKELNGERYEFDSALIDTSIYSGVYIDEVLLKEGIDRATLEEFRKQLIDLGFISFKTLDEGEAILFTIDGFIDNSYGFAYSQNQNLAEDNSSGRISYSKVYGNWYSWSAS